MAQLYAPYLGTDKIFIFVRGFAGPRCWVLHFLMRQDSLQCPFSLQR